MIVIEIEKWEQSRCRDLRVQNLKTHFEAFSAAIALVEGSTGKARTINPYDILIQTTSLNYRNNRNAFSIDTRRSGPLTEFFLKCVKISQSRKLRITRSIKRHRILKIKTATVGIFADKTVDSVLYT